MYMQTSNHKHAQIGSKRSDSIFYRPEKLHDEVLAVDMGTMSKSEHAYSAFKRFDSNVRQSGGYTAEMPAIVTRLVGEYLLPAGSVYHQSVGCENAGIL